MSKVYLAGAIAGLTEGEAKDWRTYVSRLLAPAGIIGINPLRCEPSVNGRYDLNYDCPKFGQSRTIRAKNIFDIRNSDLTLAYLPLPEPGKRASYGSLWEVGAAEALNKPVIIVSNDPIIKAHPLFGGTSDWLLDNLNDAVEVCIGILKDHSHQPIYIGMDLARAEGLRNSPEAPF